MVAKNPSFRIDGGSYNQLLNYTRQKRRRSIYDGYASIATNMLREEIQPTITRNYSVHNTDGENSQPSLSVLGPKARSSSYFVSEYIQQRCVQPPRVRRREDGMDQKATNSSETKKRTRSSCRGTKTTIPSELRIDGDLTNDIINEIRFKSSSLCIDEGSSILLKRIRKSITATGDLESENEMDDSLLLREALKELVQNKGSSWKRIRIHECSPFVLEVLMKSSHCHNFEEIHIVGMCNDEKDQTNYGQSIMPQTESSPESESLSSLVVSLLKNTNRIRELVLKNCKLENFDLIRVMNALCSHHSKSLERLDLRFNKFTPLALRSIVAVQLRSSLHSLKSLKLRQGIRCVVHRNIRDAILQSLKCNRVILESIDVFDWDKSVQYRLDINRAKRRLIFCNNDRFPRTLWPILLEQGLICNEENVHDALTKTKASPLPSIFGPKRFDASNARREASVLYHIFRNGGPMLLEQQHSKTHSATLDYNETIEH